MKRFGLGLVVVLGLASGVRANTIADWTFETSQPTTAGPLSPEVGSGSATAFHATTSTYSSPAGNGSAHSFSSNNWSVGDYYQFSTSTVGFSGINLSWDQVSSGTGPSQFLLEYSTDGSSFSNVSVVGFSNPYAVSTSASWSSGSTSHTTQYAVDLTSISGVDNQATVYFRLVNQSTVASTGTDRVDNFTVATAPLPDAMGGGLVLLGLLALGRKWRVA